TTRNLTVTLSPSSGAVTTVQYLVAGGTATPGSSCPGPDYVTVPPNTTTGTLTFPIGTPTQTIPFTGCGAPSFEKDDTIVVVISNPSNATIPPAANQGTLTITNDDAPVAANDSYTTNEDTPLNVTAPGVLGNDTDVDSIGLTATLVTGPTHGTLTLNADGS